MNAREVSTIMTYLEGLAVDPDAPHAELDRIRDNLHRLLIEAGLDPADPLHRRAFVLGLIGAQTFCRTEFERSMNSAGVLRPPVVTA